MRRDSNCYVCAVYSGHIAALLIGFKKGRAPAAHRTLAHSFLPHLRYYLNECASDGEKIILTHPPGSIKSRLNRGYDHMNRLCKSLSAAIRPRVELRALFRRRQSASQKQLDRETRKENMKNAVSLRMNRLDDLDSGHGILILDDVITTGATLEKCRELLTEAGFTRVYCMALLTD